MKQLVITILFTLALSSAIISCDKDNEGIGDPIISELVSMSYSPDEMNVQVKQAFKSNSAALQPKDVAVSFKITKITKDGKSYKNPLVTGFSIDEKGRIVASQDNELEAGSYELEISAFDLSDEKNEKKKTDSFTVTIE
jgi:5-hydroxyisourate hydrolase-like protein (transthyretin family)